jgi:hypothetical protein
LKSGFANHSLQDWLVEVVQVNGELEIVPEVAHCVPSPAIEFWHGDQQQPAGAQKLVTPLKSEPRRVQVFQHLAHDDAIERSGWQVRVLKARAAYVKSLFSREVNGAFIELQTVHVPTKIPCPVQISARSTPNLQQTFVLSAVRQIEEEEVSE